MFLMLQDVAVPHVLVPAGPWARNNGERQIRREVEFHKHGGHLACVHAHCFLPTQFVRLWTDCHSGRRENGAAACQLEGLTREHLKTLTRWKWIGWVSPVVL